MPRMGGWWMGGKGGGIKNSPLEVLSKQFIARHYLVNVLFTSCGTISMIYNLYSGLTVDSTDSSDLYLKVTSKLWPLPLRS